MTWQAYSGLWAASLAVFGVLYVLRRRSLGGAVFVIVLFGVDIAGFAVFAADPEALPLGAQSQWLAPVTVAGVAVMVGWTAWSRLRTRVFERSVRRNDCLACVTAFLLLVALIGGTLINLEPPYAVAGLVVTAIWFLLWALPAIRTSRYARRYHLRASPEVVFPYLVDTSRWPAYRDDIEVLSADPAGPFENGSEFVARVPVPADAPARTRHPEVAFVVESVVTPRSFAVRTKARPPDHYRVDLVPDERGVWMVVRGADYVSYAAAVVGTMIDVWRERSASRRDERPSVARLRRIVESPATD